VAGGNAMKTILVIEDSETERRVLESTLQGAGWAVLKAEDGEAGLQMAFASRPDLILLDVVLPGKNGFQICRQLKRTEETSSIPVVLVTSKNQEADRYWGMKQGANAYLTKPIDEAVLQETVQELLR